MILEEFWETKQQSHVNNNFIAIFYCSVLRGKRTIPVLFLSSSIHKSGPWRKLIDDSVVQEYRFCQVSSCMGWFNSCTCSLGLSLFRVWQRVASVGISDLQVLMNFMNLKLNQNQHRWADNCWSESSWSKQNTWKMNELLEGIIPFILRLTQNWVNFQFVLHHFYQSFSRFQ